LSNIIRRKKSRGMSWAKQLALTGEKRNAYTVLVKKFEEKTNQSTQAYMGCHNETDWIHLAQGRDNFRALLNMVMNTRVL
jgi:hypothetical protein